MIELPQGLDNYVCHAYSGMDRSRDPLFTTALVSALLMHVGQSVGTCRDFAEQWEMDDDLGCRACNITYNIKYNVI